MSLVNLSLKHGLPFDQAKPRLNEAVAELQKNFGRLVRHVTWNSSRDQVRIDGAGFWLEMSVDAEELRASGDIPALAGLIGGPLAAGLRQVVERTFHKQLN
jgi:hypothetical protein